MAGLNKIEWKEGRSHTKHKRTDASYCTFEIDGEQYLQIDTYGSADRKMAGTVSQSLQFDRESAAQLVDLLKSEFAL